ncbi:TPA: copper resistance protein [Klebsiella pneumoniae subsp. pneumoniae]|uniref:copper resistance protein n=1 Tax=Klebsiella pneumoniae TaxID=573 RepID=UPI000C1EDA11|nr:copper resistance protein [Klebsiella pneumoniae]HDU4324467.1 copper resistance protein [Klebsiella pneumoniae subsp. pneumoniae]MBD7161731.1 copper resistance protein [Klebsiella pneumoniae]HBR1756538.1 copper resistance protein [Klebsiella pneumoniae]HBW7646101.1 copper resistance protein [Klebsiella pneumoniae]HDU5714658.1 copper resistance protein [Klebsiella pneumoniae subsp. pneumoniae]
MIKRQRKAILFVFLACLVVLTCTAQRMAGMHALVMNLTADSPSLQQNQDQVEAPVTPCELSAKSLMAVPPMLFEGALLAITLLLAVLAVLAAIPPRIERQWPPRVISPPRLRVHLRLCIFRE